MPKSQTISYLKISENSYQNYHICSPVNTISTHKIANHPQNQFEDTFFSNRNSDSQNTRKIEQIRQLQQTEFLRLQLFRVSKTIQAIQQQSTKLSEKIKQVRSIPKLQGNFNFENIQKSPSERKNQKENINKGGNKYPDKLFSEIFISADQFITEINLLCTNFLKFQSQKKLQRSQQQKEKRIYKKILEACDQKLLSAQTLLNQMTNRLKEKDSEVKMLKETLKKHEKDDNQNLNEKQELQYSNKLLLSDVSTYKEIIDKNALQIHNLRKIQLETTQRYEEIFTEYQRLQAKSNWFEKMYEQKRLRLAQMQKNNLAYVQEIQRLEKQLRKKQKNLAQSYNQIKTLNKDLEQFKNNLLSQNKETNRVKHNFLQQIQKLKVDNCSYQHKNSQLETKNGQIQQKLKYMQQLKELEKEKAQQLQENLNQMQVDINTLLQELRKKGFEIQELNRKIQEQQQMIDQEQFKKQEGQKRNQSPAFFGFQQQQSFENQISNIVKLDSQIPSQSCSSQNFPDLITEQKGSLEISKEKSPKFSLASFKNKYSYRQDYKYLQSFIPNSKY